MVGKMPPPGLCSCSTDRHRSVDVKTVNQLRISATRHDPKGLDVRELPLLQRKEKCFLLTSPFIEPASFRVSVNCGSFASTAIPTRSKTDARVVRRLSAATCSVRGERRVGTECRSRW